MGSLKPLEWARMVILYSGETFRTAQTLASRAIRPQVLLWYITGSGQAASGQAACRTLSGTTRPGFIKPKGLKVNKCNANNKLGQRTLKTPNYSEAQTIITMNSQRFIECSLKV